MIHHLTKSGETNLKFTEEHRNFSRSIHHNNTKIHEIARSVIDKLIERNLLKENAIDDAGGCLPKGFILTSHGGLFKLSLDRKNNALPHFIEGENVDSNLCFVAAAMNTCANIVVKYGKNTCKVLRQKVLEKHTDKDVLEIINE